MAATCVNHSRLPCPGREATEVARIKHVHNTFQKVQHWEKADFFFCAERVKDIQILATILAILSERETFTVLTL